MGMNRFSALYRFRALFVGDGKKRYIGTPLYLLTRLLFSAELKPRGYYLELFWQADLGYIGQAIIGVKVPNSSHVASIQH